MTVKRHREWNKYSLPFDGDRNLTNDRYKPMIITMYRDVRLKSHVDALSPKRIEHFWGMLMTAILVANVTKQTAIRIK